MRIFLHCESNERSFFCVSFTINIDSISQRNGIVSLRKAKLIGTRQPCQGWSQGFELNVLNGAQNTLTTNNGGLLYDLIIYNYVLSIFITASYAEFKIGNASSYSFWQAFLSTLILFLSILTYSVSF